MAQQHSPRFVQIVEEAKSRVAEISAPELAARLKSNNGEPSSKGEPSSNPRQSLIDVREASEFAAGHIPTAQHLCKGIIERDIETLVPDPSTEIILYCGGGYRSALAADNLQKMGYRRVLSLAGGWRTWTESNLPIEPSK